jgi:diguanylate cyclase (GGDEF)-like protein
MTALRESPGRDAEDASVAVSARPLTPQEITDALAQGRVEVHFQPVVVMPSGRVVAFEALARIRTPAGSLVPPSSFIPVAEASGLIVPLGQEVLQQAIAAAGRWRAGTSDIATASISVNVAPAQLVGTELVQIVRTLLAVHDVPATALVLEITESTASSPQVRPTLEQLSALGTRVALDDFGTGFATLDNLRWLPVQLLKLDRGFVEGLTDGGADHAIVKAVADLADNLGLSVIAEGVETVEQAEALQLLGCPVMQGFLFAPAQRDPEVAARTVHRNRRAFTKSSTDHVLGGGDERWPLALDAAILAAIRLLASRRPVHRSTVHAVATGLARTLELSPETTRVIGRLALLHDVRRLSVDGALPDTLASEPLVHALAARKRHPPPEVALVRAATAVADQAARRSAVEARPLDQTLVASALRAEASGRSGRRDWLAGAMTALATDPPEIHPLGELVDDLERRRLGRRGIEERLRSLVGLTQMLSSSGDTMLLLRVALEEVRRIVGAASASLERWERDSGQLRTLVNVGQLGPGEVTFPTDEVYPLAGFEQARRTMLDGLPFVHTVDDEDCAVEAVELLRSLNKYSSAAVPLYVDDRIWGQVWMATEVGEPAFSSGDIETLLPIATLMAGVIRQAENLEQVARAAFEDSLTRVGNRRAVDDELDRLSAAERPTALVLLDLDLLKQINDSLGHAAGDQAIRDVADALSQEVAVWPGATVGRLGGDEFCVVVPDCPPWEARNRVQAAMDRVRERGGPAVSIGVASLPPPWSWRDLFAAADGDLYRAKGRAVDERAAQAPVTGAAPSRPVRNRRALRE